MLTSFSRATLIGALFAGSFFTVAQADDEMPTSGFMDDYSILKATDNPGGAEYIYLSDDAFEQIAAYDAVMIDEPEVFISPDSDYKGAKPKELAALSDEVRKGIAVPLSDDFYVVDQPGPNVMYIRVGLTHLDLKKKRRRLIGYTPVGLVAGAVIGAASTDLARDANLQGMAIEGEVYDSSTGDLLVALIDVLGDGEEAPASWEELEAATLAYGELIACRLGNAKLPADQRQTCGKTKTE